MCLSLKVLFVRKREENEELFVCFFCNGMKKERELRELCATGKPAGELERVSICPYF